MVESGMLIGQNIDIFNNLDIILNEMVCIYGNTKAKRRRATPRTGVGYPLSRAILG